MRPLMRSRLAWSLSLVLVAANGCSRHTEPAAAAAPPAGTGVYAAISSKKSIGASIFDHALYQLP